MTMLISFFLLHFSDKLGSEKSEITSCFASSNYANGPTIGMEQRFIPKCKIKRPNDFYVRTMRLFLLH